MPRSLFIALAALAAACSQPAETPASAPAASAAQPLTATGEPTALMQTDVDDNLNGAVQVVSVDDLTLEENSGVKLFGTAGGDPAMNGLYTYIAFYMNPAEGWRIFQLGDFLDYRIVSESPGRVDLELRESLYDEASGEISSRTRHIIVAWTRDAELNPPNELMISAATAP